MRSKWMDLTLHLELKSKPYINRCEPYINSCKEFVRKLLDLCLLIGITTGLILTSYWINKPYLTYVQTLKFDTLGNLELKFIFWTLFIVPVDIVLFASILFLIYCIVALLVISFSGNKE